MTQAQFIKIKLSAKTPEFKSLVGLIEDQKTSELLDFMSLLHPNQSKHAQGSRGDVFGNKHFTFILFKTHILRTDVYTGTKKLYTRF